MFYAKSSEIPLDVTGEKAMLLASIELAIADNDFKWLYDWSTECVDQPFSFPWCCVHLGLEPTIVRENIKSQEEIGRGRRGIVARVELLEQLVDGREYRIAEEFDQW